MFQKTETDFCTKSLKQYFVILKIKEVFLKKKETFFDQLDLKKITRVALISILEKTKLFFSERKCKHSKYGSFT